MTRRIRNSQNLSWMTSFMTNNHYEDHTHIQLKISYMTEFIYIFQNKPSIKFWNSKTKTNKTLKLPKVMMWLRSRISSSIWLFVTTTTTFRYECENIVSPTTHTPCQMDGIVQCTFWCLVVVCTFFVPYHWCPDEDT